MTSPEQFGAVPDGRQDCAAALEKALAAGPVRLAPGGTYRVRRPVAVPSRARLVGDRTSRIVGSFEDFPSTVKQGPFDLALLAIRRAEDVRLAGFQIAFEAAPESWMVGVALAASRRCALRDLEIFGFNRGYMVALDSCFECEVTACVLRDSRIDATTFGQLTGVSVDENRIDGRNSEAISISHNRIARLTATPAFERAFGYQTDGINLSGTSQDGSGTRATIRRNVVSEVGEGIDTFGAGGLIEGNVLVDCVLAGVKLVHGANNNRVVGNLIDGVGMWGVVLGGSALGRPNTDNNLIEGNAITRIGDVPKPPTSSPVAFRFVASSRSTPVTRTMIRNNRIFATPKAEFAMQVRDAGPAPGGISYRSNYYDGSGRRGEIDDARGVDYLPIGPKAGLGDQSHVSSVSTRAAIALLDFERKLIAAR